MSPMRETDNAGEVLMPVAQTDALQHVEITVLRQMGDNIAAQTRAMEKLSAEVRDVSKDVAGVLARVIRLEEQKVSKEVDDLKGELKEALKRVDQLERTRDEAKGASNVWAFLSKNAGWLFAGATAFVAGLAMKAGLIR